MSYLDVLLRKVIQIGGVSLTERRLWNFVSGATAVDNPSTGATDITVTGAAAPTGTGYITVTGGVQDAAASTLGAGVATFLSTPSSVNFASALTGETGTGGVVFDTGPTISAPVLSSTPTLSGHGRRRQPGARSDDGRDCYDARQLHDCKRQRRHRLLAGNGC